jgi:hypothetical protein
MMRSFLLRALGSVLVLAGLAGIVFALAVIALVWRGQPQVETTLSDNLLFIEDILRVTDNGLGVAATSLDSTITSVGSLQTTLEQVAQATGQTVPAIENLTTLTEEELPAAIRSAQVSLVSAQNAAQVIDRILRVIAGIPLLGRSLSYNPEVPMHDALGQVVADLEAVPATLEQIGKSISSSDDQLLAIQASLELMAVDIAGVNSGLEQGQEVILEYQLQVNALQIWLARARASLPNALDGVAWFFTLSFLWLGIAQLSVIVEGLRMLGVRFDLPLRDQASSGG